MSNLESLDEILCHFSEDRAPVAIYLAGQGPYREPKPLEVQHLRVVRYIEHLNKQCNDSVRIIGVFIDLNNPRSDRFDEAGFPEFARLLELAAARQISAVLGDLAQSDSRYPPFHWVTGALSDHGVPYIDGGLDAGGVIASDISARLAPSNGYRPSDAEDMLAFFPGLCEGIIYEFLEEAERSEPAEGRAAHEACAPFRRSSLKKSPIAFDGSPSIGSTRSIGYFESREPRAGPSGGSAA